MQDNKNNASPGNRDDERPTTPDGYSNKRPSLNSALAEELRSSFRDRDAQQSARRQQIRERMQRRRESKASMRSLQLPADSIREEEEGEISDEDAHPPPKSSRQAPSPQKSSTRPKLSNELVDELKKSIHGRETRNFEKRQQIRARVLKRRQSERMGLTTPDSSFHSFDFQESFAGEGSSVSDGRSMLSPTRSGKNPRHFSRRDSVDTFDASFSGESFEPLRTDAKRKSPRSTFDGMRHSDTTDSDEAAEQAKLVQERKKLRREATSDKKKISALMQEVEDLKSEGKDLRKQLATWQDKTSSISRRQSEERLKFENSTDLIAKARVDLTKALHDNSMLKSRMNDLENALAQKDIKLRSVSDIMASQSEKIDELASRLRDTEAELRFNVDDKQRLEEELSVLMAAKDGVDIGATLRRLEQEKAEWLEDKGRALEAKRLALEEENDRILQREQRRSREEADTLTKVEKKSKKREEEQKKLQETINLQLKEMKEANRELQSKFKLEHTENRAESKKKDRTISMLEQEVSKLRRKLAASQLREQENEIRRSEIESANDDLEQARAQNRVLEKQIKKLRKETESGKGDWKEVILPGYKNLRGVTFGAPSDELAGFLTILVEDQKSKQSHALSNLQKEVQKYLKDPKKAKGKDKDKSSSKKEKLKKEDKKKSKKDKKSKKVETKSKKNSRKSKKKKEREIESEESSDPETESSVEESEEIDKKHKSKSKKDGKSKKKKEAKKKKEEATESSEESQSADYEWGGKDKTKGRKSKRKEHKKAKPVKSHKKSKSEQRATDRNISYIASALNSKTSKRKSIDEVSLVVMKRDHNRKTSNARHRGRLPSVIPPATIILQ